MFASHETLPQAKEPRRGRKRAKPAAPTTWKRILPIRTLSLSLSLSLSLKGTARIDLATIVLLKAGGPPESVIWHRVRIRYRKIRPQEDWVSYHPLMALYMCLG